MFRRNGPQKRPTWKLLGWLGVFVLGLTMLSSMPASANGNNGTIKIHEAGTPSGTENNDPKACSFNVEGFGFDVGQTGYIMFDVQGGDGPTGTPAGPFNFGPANADGFYATQYFDLENGHYKATLYDDADNEKAKSKVFKVVCDEEPPPVQCPDGTNPGDVDGDGDADAADCDYVPPPTDECPNIPGNQPPGTDCNPPTVECPGDEVWYDDNGNGVVDPHECAPIHYDPPPPGDDNPPPGDNTPAPNNPPFQADTGAMGSSSNPVIPVGFMVALALGLALLFASGRKAGAKR